MKKLSVGYIVDDGMQSELIHDLIARSKTASGYAIDVLIIQKLPANAARPLAKILGFIRRKGWLKLIEKMMFMRITRVDRMLVMRNPIYQSHFNTYPLDAFSIPKLYVTPVISKSGLVYRYRADDLEMIKQKNLDVLVRGGSGILRGDILTIAPHGILSFHHADNDVNRGGPPGFWEVYHRNPSTGFIIKRLSDELDGGDVVFKGAIPTSSHYLLNLAKLYRKSNVFMHRLLESVAAKRELPPVHPKQPYSYPLYTAPRFAALVWYGLRAFAQVVMRVLDKLRGRTLRWSVAYQYVADWQSAVLWKSRVIKNPPQRFLADPFVWRQDGLDVCFVEDFDYRSGKGKISAYKIDANRYEELGVALEEPFHLSYPYLFEADGALYMCPETHAAGDIRIYKCTNFPLQWTLHQVLMRDVSAADTNLFAHDNRWWMLTNMDSAGMDDHSSELHAFYADRFDSTAWIAHPMNPIIFDSAQARNGGMILDKGALHRVFQTQGFDVYGAAMGIAEITTLTPDAYHEKVIARMTPNYFSNLRGTHSYSFSKGLLAFDYVKKARYKN